jgi:hypothetical protein
MGKEGIPILVDILKHSKQPELQAAAAKGLGDLGNTHNDSSVVPPLLEMLDAPGIDITVQTEIAWALGRVPDRRSVQPLFDLDKKLQKSGRILPIPRSRSSKKRCSGPSSKSILKTNTVRAQWCSARSSLYRPHRPWCRLR